MLIEPLRPIHAGDYRALMLEAYALHPDAFSSSVAERAALPLSWWQARLSEEPLAAQQVLGVFQDGGLAGVAGLTFESREKLRHKATLFGMYVPARCRQQGLGRRLVQAVLAQAAGRPGVRLVQLTVTQGNDAASALYARCGFVPYGVEPYAVAAGTAYVAKIHMWCNIGFPGVSLSSLT